MKRIATKLIAWFLLISVIPLALVAVLAHTNAEQSLRREIGNHLRATADSKAQQIHSFFHERVMDVQTLAHNPAVADALHELADAFNAGTPGSAQYRVVDEKVRPFLTAYIEESGYSDLLFVSANGQLVFAVNRKVSADAILSSEQHQDSQIARVADHAATLLEPSLSNFQQGDPSGAPAAFIAAPVMRDEAVLGVVVLQISNRNINALAQDYTGLGETGETVIGSRVGDQVVFVVPLRHDPRAAFRRRSDFGSDIAVPMQQALQGIKGQGDSIDYRGRAVLASWQYVPSFRWGLVVKIDAKEALAPVTRLRRQSIMLGVIAIIAVIVIALFVSRTISRPIERLKRSANTFAEGNYTEQVTVESMDEIGELAETFNRMADKIAHSHATLEQRVDQRTAELRQEVADRRQAEDDLRIAKTDAEHANHAKSAFLANMSHEIRTPMNGIMGMANLLQHTQLTTEQGDFLVMIQQSANSLLRILNDILDLSKIESGRLELEAIEFSLRDCVGKAAKTLSARAADKELELACRIAPDLPDSLIGDPGRLGQVIVNLGGNAIKFTEQGEVVIELTEKSRSDGEITLHFSVQDTGVGIPTEKQVKIFDPFSQADVSTTRQFGGTGLGLSISSQLVEMMKGQIWLESELGRGSTFHFTVTMETSDAPPQRLSRSIGVLAGVKTLVVDDNITNRRIMVEMLRIWGLNVSSADGGKRAIDVIREAASKKAPIQLVLLDLMMPEMDGFALAEQIGREADSDEPKMIMVSSAGRSGDMARCRQLGIGRYLMKPIIQSELLNAMLEIFGAGVSAEHDGHPVAGPRLRVLLVEDGLINQRVAIGLLQHYGHDVVLAINGKEAVQRFEQQAFDVVLMDVQMPEMDGHQATEAIRRMEKGSTRHTPIIAMTAGAMKGDRERCLESGMDGYIAKPINPDQLFETLGQIAPVAGRDNS